MKKKPHCSEKFLRSCLWSVRSLSEEQQVEMVLRRACQKLRLQTQEGCFTDPEVTKKYIERCFGQEIWDAVREEVAQAQKIGEVELIAKEFAFGTTLPQDIALLNEVFGVDTGVSKYRRKEVTPALYKHGKRREFGLRNTYACRASRGWVMSEYNAACKMAVLNGERVEEPYLWLKKELDRVLSDKMSVPRYTMLVEGVPKPMGQMPDCLQDILEMHFGYTAGLYDIVCHLVTKRIIPDFKDDVRALWHNVWYFQTNLYKYSAEYRVSQISLMELVYVMLLEDFAPRRRGQGLRLMYDASSIMDRKLAGDACVRSAILRSVKNGDCKLGCELLEVLLTDDGLLMELFGDEDEKLLRKSFRDVFRTYCYTDYVLSGISGYVMSSKHAVDASPYRSAYPELDVKGVVTVAKLQSVGSDGEGSSGTRYVTHDYLLLNDCLDGDAFAQMLSEVRPVEKIKAIYVGTDKLPRVLVKADTPLELLQNSIELFDYTEKKFVQLPEEAFRQCSVVTSGSVAHLLGSTNMLGSGLSPEELERIRHIECGFVWGLVYDAIDSLNARGEGAGLIKMDDPCNFGLKSFRYPPYPMMRNVINDASKDGYVIGTSLPLTVTRLKPVYILLKSLDSYYGLTAFGGVEIVADSSTDMALLLKKHLFLTALGLKREWFEDVGFIEDLWFSRVSDGLRSFRMRSRWDEAVTEVANMLWRHELCVAPISLHNLRTHTMMDIFEAADKVTWSGSHIAEVRRLKM